MNDGEAAAREGSAVLLVDHAGRVLLQQRDDPVPPAGVGRWAVPGGGREGDEDPLATARREFEEETGVAISRLRQFATYEPERDPWMGRFRLSLFVAEDDVPREAMVVNEGLDFQYWTPDEALALPMNPSTRRYLEDVFASRLYEATVERRATGPRWASVIALDRWGRALVVQPGDTGRPGSFCLPGALGAAGESPDRAAFRGFGAATGHTPESLKLFAALRQEGELPSGPALTTHVYYDDPDLALENLELEAGGTAAYLGPGDLPGALLADYTAVVLGQFFESAAYKGMFH